jgi:hypothetical protein
MDTLTVVAALEAEEPNRSHCPYRRRDHPHGGLKARRDKKAKLPKKLLALEKKLSQIRQAT